MTADGTAHILFWCFSIFVAIVMGTIAHLYFLLEALRDKNETSIENLKTIVDADKSNLTVIQISIASMVTRTELDRQVERLIAEIERRIPARNTRQ